MPPVSITPVPLPIAHSGMTPTDVLTAIDDWVSSAPLRRLVSIFGGHCPTADPDAVLLWLDEFSAKHWDFRGGRERAEAREPTLDPATARTVVEAARALGLVDPLPPQHQSYRHLIVLGGLANACLLRAGYAAHLLGSATVTATEIGLLGSLRPLTTAEHDTLDAVGVDGCRSEVDVLDAAVRRSFDGHTAVAEKANPSDDEPHRSWLLRTYQPADGPTVRVLAAPSSEPSRRAHTADTQRFWAQRVSLSPGDRVLVVTSPIYVPFQHCDAVRTLGLPYGCDIDTVGVDPAFIDDGLPKTTLTAGRYLQEIRSAIRSMRALYAAVNQPAGGAT